MVLIMSQKLTRKQFWIRLGEELCDKIRTRTKKGQDVDDSNFKKLSKGYEKYKKAGGGPRQSSSKVKPTDLQYTGDMLRDLQVRGSSDEHVTIGWTGAMAERVRENEERGRFISKENKPISRSEQKYIQDELDEETPKGVNKSLDEIWRGRKTKVLHMKL